jgi:hypothetical protein
LKVGENSHIELLLNPGSYARLGSDTNLRWMNTQLTHMEMELRSGSMEIEAVRVKSAGRIKVSMGGHDFFIVKDGMYRFDTKASGISSARVFKGQLQVMASNGILKKIKKSGEVDIGTGGPIAFVKFDPRVLDNLTEWGALRAAQLARANWRATARYESAGIYSGLGWPVEYFGYWGGGWFYDPFFGYYTFFPGRFWFNSFYGPIFSGPPVIIVGQPNGTRSIVAAGRTHEGLTGAGSASSNQGIPSMSRNPGAEIRSSGNASEAVGRASAGGAGHSESISRKN